MTKKLDVVRSTVKVVVMEDDPTAKDLIVISFYDTNGFYFLPTVMKDVWWL